MDFFAAQDHARRSTRWLVLWFALAVLGIIAVVYLAAAFALRTFGTDALYGPPPPLWNVDLFLGVAVGLSGLILAGSLYKIIHLSRDGGARIAEELGGRLVSRSTTDLRERRLINVVEEMAIASGIPAPPVYVLDAEGSINAFAAGARPAEAVVAVTRGALEQLPRDELQGVVAHEFSHILNGDMRLNLRLLAVLHGILLLTLTGRILMRSAGRSDRNGLPFVVAGVALAVTGYIGVLCGKLIKAGVSRQREFLADASAVQFTRNPSGIAGALARIGKIGSAVQHPRAEEASHMFFGSSARLSSLMATHPPVEERIRRIDPVFQTRQRIRDRKRSAAAESASQPEAASPAPAHPGISGFAPERLSAAVGTVTPDDVDRAHALIEALPAELTEALQRPSGARSLILALLLSPQAEVQAGQLQEVERSFGLDTREECARLARSLQTLGAGQRLPLLDLALPALSEFADAARAELLAGVDVLIRADGRTSAFEYVARRLLHAVLLPARNRLLPSYVSPAKLRRATGRLLALLARAGHADEAQARAAFQAAAARAPFDGEWHFEDHASRFSSIELDRILDKLSTTQPRFRQKLVEACAAAALHDARVTASEMEVLRAVCQALDSPLPQLDPAAFQP